MGSGDVTMEKTAPAARAPKKITAMQRNEPMKYGENPYQKDVEVYQINGTQAWKLEVVSGSALGYNNLLDIDRGVKIVRDFKRRAAAVTKHAVPTGVAEADNGADAVRLALETNPVARYGCGLTINFPLTMEIAHVISERVDVSRLRKEGQIANEKNFIDVLTVPSVEMSGEIRSWLAGRPMMKLVVCEFPPAERPLEDFRFAAGRLLKQEGNDENLKPTKTKEWRRVTGPPYRFDPEWAKKEKERKNGGLNSIIEPEDTSQLEVMDFAWRAVRHAKSNGVLLAKRVGTTFYTVGIGAGQTARIKAARDAIEIAGERAAGAVCASDAFFPFRDSVDALAEAGVRYVVQAGGSKRDVDSVEACVEHKINMWFSGYRVFLH